MYYRAAMARQARHRMLDGFLARLAAQPDVDAYALRGGMLVRHWHPDRPAKDVDLVCRLPFDPKDVRERLARVLATEVTDGVQFDAQRFRLDVLRPTSRHPGLRLFAAGRTDGRATEMTADLTFQLDVWPDAELARLGEAELFVCRPAMLIGRKLQVTSELGRHHWRPKDLFDLWLMLRERPPTTAVLGEAVERSFFEEAGDADIVAEPPSWWREPRTAARWSRFARGVRAAPRDVETVADEVHQRLAGLLRSR